jgi:hypothetical protein
LAEFEQVIESIKLIAQKAKTKKTSCRTLQDILHKKKEIIARQTKTITHHKLYD